MPPTSPFVIYSPFNLHTRQHDTDGDSFAELITLLCLPMPAPVDFVTLSAISLTTPAQTILPVRPNRKGLLRPGRCKLDAFKDAKRAFRRGCSKYHVVPSRSHTMHAHRLAKDMIRSYLEVSQPGRASDILPYVNVKSVCRLMQMISCLEI